MKIGVEIECFMPYSSCEHIHNIRKSYHSGHIDPTSKWRFEQDGSLNVGRAHAFTVEMISPILSTLAEVKSSLNTLFFSRIGFNRNTPVLNGHKINEDNEWVADWDAEDNMDLLSKHNNGYLGLNKTCGCHIHFSKHGKDTPSWPVELCEKLAADYAEWLKFAYPHAYPLYIKQYNRDYAQKIGEDKKGALSVRKSEFYYTSNNQGIEWRAFNLAGSKTIGEVIDRIVQAYTLIEKWSRVNHRHLTTYEHTYKEQNLAEDIVLAAYFQELKDSYVLIIDGLGYELDKVSETKITMRKKTTSTQLSARNIKSITSEEEIFLRPTEEFYELNRTYKCVI